jgi:predicted nucleotide-binding protein (sugar kinase/HSP70/actin superfamily)
MIDIREHARNLIAEFYLCSHAKPRNNAVDIQIEKDACSEWVNYLIRQINWGEDNDVAEASHQLESRLRYLKEKVIIEVLTNGAI